MIVRMTFFVWVYTLVFSNANTTNPHPLSDEFITFINLKQNSWKAGRNFPVHATLDTLKKLMGVREDPLFTDLISVVHENNFIIDLPENFDPRDKWPNCPTLNEVRDQGACGSCWAFGAVEAMTDRYCIYSNGTKHFHFSAEDLLSCCANCGFGCDGGFPTSAWQYWKHFGIVSGGNYNSFQGCRPYEIPPCEHIIPVHILPCNNLKTPNCSRTCEKTYPIVYKKDKKFGKYVYSVKGEEDHIRAEIFKNGPVEGTLTVYSDFLSYKTGIYRHIKGDKLGGHAVKILGWGVENSQKYWLITNSWNTNWGDKGFFKIVRGENHCGIEDLIIAGEPLFNI